MHVLIAALHRPTKPTGVCRHAVNLAICLAEKSKITQVTLVVGAWQLEYFKTTFVFSSDKIQLIAVEIKNSSVSRNLWFLWGLPRLANSYASDIVHLSFPFPIFRFLFKAPTVSTIHDLYPYECPENFGFPQVWFNQMFLRQCIDNSDGLTCVSQVTLDKLKFYFPNCDLDRLTNVIYNYVDFSEVQPQIPKQCSQGDLFLLSVAQHRKNKNLDLIIKAYNLLLYEEKININTKLIIVGSVGPETENLQSLILKLDLGSNVILLSAISDEELCWLYQNCLVFVIASSTEGFCLPLVEALTFSDRIVCSDIPIFKEVGSSSCTYFQLKANPLHELSKAIINSSNKPVIFEQKCRKLYSKEQIADKYIRFYENVKNVSQ